MRPPLTPRALAGALLAALALGAGGGVALAQAPAPGGGDGGAGTGGAGTGGAQAGDGVTATTGNPATSTDPSAPPPATTTPARSAAPARATARAAVNVRASPGTGRVVARLRRAAPVEVLCHKVAGVYASPSGASRVWDRVRRGADGAAWVADGYLTTGSDGLVAPLCGAPTVTSAPVPGATQGQCGLLAPVAVLPPFATTEAFVAAAVPGAQASQAQDRVPASVTLAQGILETGGGRFTALANNYFGLKAQPVTGQAFTWTYGSNAVGCVLKKTLEQESRGLVRTIQAFRAYDTLEGSILDHGQRLVENPVYAPAFRDTGDADRFATEIAKHYATDPGYAGKLLSLMDRYKLRRYDR